MCNVMFCMSNRPDGLGTVTVEEKERFEEIKERLRVLLENQITNFRYVDGRVLLQMSLHLIYQKYTNVQVKMFKGDST